ncbi:MAG: RidA family protein [Verrucomicrobiota bacterium]|jgi:2-iminobutanoate/2-iminopropanoate deaminase|nr:reactive intermediate/imine deaminase [Verrucomicrobiota bacterium]
MKRAITSDRAPKAVGPYSQAVAFGHLLFCSGQIPLDPVSGEIVGADVAAQTERVIENIKAVLAVNAMSLGDAIKTTVFLTTMDDFAAMNEVYARHFTQPFPSRSTVAVVALPRGAKVEIEVTAGKSQATA